MKKLRQTNKNYSLPPGLKIIHPRCCEKTNSSVELNRNGQNHNDLDGNGADQNSRNKKSCGNGNKELNTVDNELNTSNNNHKIAT